MVPLICLSSFNNRSLWNHISNCYQRYLFLLFHHQFVWQKSLYWIGPSLPRCICQKVTRQRQADYSLLFLVTSRLTTQLGTPPSCCCCCCSEAEMCIGMIDASYKAFQYRPTTFLPTSFNNKKFIFWTLHNNNSSKKTRDLCIWLISAATRMQNFSRENQQHPLPFGGIQRHKIEEKHKIAF